MRKRRNTQKDDTKITCVLRVKIAEPQHLNAIREFAASIIGEICWEARLGYGDELKLNVGDRLDSGIRQRQWGSWRLGGRGTDWKLVDSEGDIVASDMSPDSDAPEGTEQNLQVIVNRRIVALEPQFPDLGVTITFDNHYQLTILPTPDDDQYELAYWELFTPSGLLEVGPGSAYTCTSWVK